MAFRPNGQELITAGDHPDDAGRVWPVPAPLTGDIKAVEADVERLTGLSIREDQSIGPLTSTHWLRLVPDE